MEADLQQAFCEEARTQGQPKTASLKRQAEAGSSVADEQQQLHVDKRIKLEV